MRACVGVLGIEATDGAADYVCAHAQGVNGWRTAHNPPNPALLDATDSIGMVVWDETHRNGNLPELELLIKRDRNHPRYDTLITALNSLTSSAAALCRLQCCDLVPVQ